ncbi:MAG: conjugative transfer signal peptidase TraF [Desulfobulbus sp.]|nr:conjugative transfer signal peptidase TraF [Desulfobulbus sp.]
MKSICAISLCISIVAVVCWQLGLRVNLTSSLPVGLYRLASEPLHRGQIVAFCLDDPKFIQLARERGYLAPGSCPSGLRPLLKVINGLPGDKICSFDGRIMVNNRVLEHTKILGRDNQGRAMPPSHLSSGVIPAGKALLLSQHHDGSFDSRYFGLVPIVSLRPVEPVITF